MNWCFQALKRYATFSGRACRKEYWAFTVMDIVVSYGAGALGTRAGVFHSPWFYVPFITYMVLIISPRLAVTCRRLHDVNKTGAYMLWYIIPIVGLIMVTIQLLKKGDEAKNNYGEPCQVA